MFGLKASHTSVITWTKMKHKILFIFLLILPIIANGQEMEVESITATPFDLTASTNKRLDNNGNACAMVKVVLPIQNVSFEGNVIGDVKYDGGEYHVYLPGGSKNLRIKHPQKRPLIVNFADFGIKIDGNQTYQLTVKTDTDKENVTFKISPKDAILTVDQQEYPTENGMAILSLTPEEHNYTIFAPGYLTQGNKFMVYSGQNNKIIVELDPKDNTTAQASNQVRQSEKGKDFTPFEMFEKGMAAELSSDYQEALKWYRKAAELGHAEAQFNLGEMYVLGKGVSNDYYEAANWFLKSAEQGNVGAQIYLGMMYDGGDGVSQDDSEAAKWFQKAAEQGDEHAQFTIGLRYKRGEGVAQDYHAAAKWFRKAAEQGLDLSQYVLGEMYYNGEGVTQDYYEAVKWFRMAAEQGNVGAQYNLGLMYSRGEGVDQDFYETVKWYRKAAEQGDDRAQFSLGGMYFNGIGVDEDVKEAIQWYRLAAEQGYKDAQFILGIMYRSGDSVIKDNYEAAKWLRLAADQGDRYSQYILGQMYEDGEGVAQNYSEARKLYEKAAAQGHVKAAERLKNL